jgi:hypothetical protein
MAMISIIDKKDVLKALVDMEGSVEVQREYCQSIW